MKFLKVSTGKTCCQRVVVFNGGGTSNTLVSFMPINREVVTPSRGGFGRFNYISHHLCGFGCLLGNHESIFLKVAEIFELFLQRVSMIRNGPRYYNQVDFILKILMITNVFYEKYI